MKHQEELRKALEDLREPKIFSDYEEKAYDDLKEESIHWEKFYTRLLNHVKSQSIFKELKDEDIH